MNPETTKAARTRAFIIEKTADIFNRKGYAGTAMSDLITATGLSKGSIYGNFQNKEEVALAVFDYNYARILKAVKASTKKADSVHDKLMAYAQVYRQIIKDAINRGGCPILNTAIEADDTNILLKNKASMAIKRWEDNIQALIRQGIELGEFRADTRVRQTALSIIALIEGGVMISRTTGDSQVIDEILYTVDSLILAIKE